MDSNYEAQKQLTRQRLAARHEQAAAERALREGRSAQNGRLKQLLLYLFRQSERRGSKQQKSSPRPAIAGKGKG